MSYVPVIDLFAGPGGLGEGFSSEICGKRPFRIAVSVERDFYAHQTLSLRSFYRGFKYKKTDVPDAYYKYLAGEIDRKELEDAYPAEWKNAYEEAMCAELGNPKYQPSIDKKIEKAIKEHNNWILIGGPPCQAYSLVGRARMSNAKDYVKKRGHGFEKDHRHVLYQQYLRIIAMYSPAVFVMENVKGILSAKLNGEKIFPKIIEDLKDPYKAGVQYKWENIKAKRYNICSFVCGMEPDDHSQYLIRSEEYDVPQARHRVILLGIRNDIWEKISGQIKALKKQEPVTVTQIIGMMPPLRSGFSKGKCTETRWKNYFCDMQNKQWVKSLDTKLRDEVISACKKLESEVLKREHREKGSFLPDSLPSHKKWHKDDKLQFLPNHETRSHMDSDLDRYLFVSAFGKVNKSSPRLKDFPNDLLPNHVNVQEAIITGKFADRFKVQLEGNPSSTITCHISKDGHYYIHPDPVQCRSLTVREAARLQTFPDNYFFEGGRTQQYHQVGNAVPPLLAKQLAEIVWNIMKTGTNMEC